MFLYRWSERNSIYALKGEKALPKRIHTYKKLYFGLYKNAEFMSKTMTTQKNNEKISEPLEDMNDINMPHRIIYHKWLIFRGYSITFS